MESKIADHALFYVHTVPVPIYPAMPYTSISAFFRIYM